MIDSDEMKRSIGTFHSIRTTEAARMHHTIRYGREKEPDVMDTAHILCDCDSA